MTQQLTLNEPFSIALPNSTRVSYEPPSSRAGTVVPTAALHATRPRSFHDERAAFEALFPMLIAQHHGQHVAISGGQVAASGATRAEVIRQFFSDAQRRGGPVYIGFVGAPRRAVRQLSPFRTSPRRDARVS